MTHSRLVAFLAAATFVASCSSSDSVDKDEVEKKVLDGLAAEPGGTPKSVECDGDLPAEVDSSVRCVMTAQDDSRIGVTVTTRSVDGDTVNFHIQVDDEPMK